MFNLEKDIERKLIKEVEACGGRCLKWVCPGWAGVPDRIVLLPGGRIYFVETKKPKGGVLSALQRKWRQWLLELGFPHWEIWKPADLARFRDEITEKDCSNCKYFFLSVHAEPCCHCEEGRCWEPYDKEV